MAVELNDRALGHARQLVRDGEVVRDERDDWSEHAPSTEQQNDFIEANGYGDYGLWHLGIDPDASEGTKGRFVFCPLAAAEINPKLSLRIGFAHPVDKIKAFRSDAPNNPIILRRLDVGENIELRFCILQKAFPKSQAQVVALYTALSFGLLLNANLSLELARFWQRDQLLYIKQQRSILHAPRLQAHTSDAYPVLKEPHHRCS